MMVDLSHTDVAALVSALGTESDRLVQLAQQAATRNAGLRKAALLRQGACDDLRGRLRDLQRLGEAARRKGRRGERFTSPPLPPLARAAREAE